MYTHCTSLQNTQAMRRERSSDSVAKRNDVVRLMSLMDKNYSCLIIDRPEKNAQTQGRNVGCRYQ